MANLYGATKTDPVNAPVGIVKEPGVAIDLPQGFTVPLLKNGSIGGNLSIGGTLNVTGITTLSNTLNTTGIMNLSTLNVSGVTTFSSTVAINGSINSSIVPQTTTTYNLGSSSYRWANGYFASLDATAISPLLPKEIKFNNTSFVHNAQNTALSFFVEGSFTGILTGCATSPSATFRYVRVGDLVVFSAGSFLEATSNATTMTITGLPAWLTPSVTKTINHIVKDNGTLTHGKLVISSDGVLTFYKDVNSTAFTASGTKGIVGLSGCYTIQ